MILRSKSGTTTASIPNRWVDSTGSVHEYPADLKTLRVEFVDTYRKLSTVSEFVKISS